jgi:hypothetical protein
MVDIQRLTPSQLTSFIHTQSLVDKQIADALRIQALREYYDGDHPVMLTQRQMEYLGPLVGGDAFPFAHNLTRTIVDTLAERLSVIGFDMGDDEAAAPIAETVWQWWNECRFDSAEAEVHTAALRDGLTYVMVSYDNEQARPRLTWHKVYDGVSGIVAHRDSEDPTKIALATRYWWQTDYSILGYPKVERKTVYLPDRILKYKRGATGWVEVLDSGETDWGLPWVDSLGAPLGVAVVEFANPGGSEIAQIIGLQNAVNKSWLDLVAAADASGFPLLVLSYPQGAPVVADDDPNTSADDLRFAPGRALEVSGGTATRIDAANLTSMIDSIWALVAAIAGVTRTPQYYLRPQGGADVPSGESLKQLESGLVGRALKRQNIFGQSWADVMQLALKVNETFGASLSFDESTLGITTKWQDAETRNDLSMAQVAEAHKRLGVPDEQVWMLLGYTPEEIASFRDVQRANDAAKVAAIAQQLQGAANNGRTNQPDQQENGQVNNGVRGIGGAPPSAGR